MGWRAAHHQKRRFAKRRLSKEANNQQLITRFLMEAHVLVGSGALENIFGLASPHDALRVALRIKQCKKREEDLFSEERISIHSLFPRRVRVREHKKDKKVRDVHHLTPQCRKDRPFHGTNRHNVLLIKVDRHKALHKTFGTKTWEEIIVILARCVAAARNIEFGTMVGMVQKAFKRSQRRKARRALRNLQLGFCPGIFRGTFLQSGRRELNPVYLLPKQAYYRYTTARMFLVASL